MSGNVIVRGLYLSNWVPNWNWRREKLLEYLSYLSVIVLICRAAALVSYISTFSPTTHLFYFLTSLRFLFLTSSRDRRIIWNSKLSLVDWCNGIVEGLYVITSCRKSINNSTAAKRRKYNIISVFYISENPSQTTELAILAGYMLGPMLKQRNLSFQRCTNAVYQIRLLDGSRRQKES